MIKTLFLTALSVSFPASLAILMLFIVSPLISRQCTAEWTYRLWLLPAIRLLIPVNAPALLQAAAELPYWIRHALHAPESYTPVPSRLHAAVTITIPQQLSIPAVSHSGKIQTGISFADAVSMLWLAGFLFFTVMHLHSYMHLRKDILAEGTYVSDSFVLQMLQELSDSLNVKSWVSVIKYSKADSPMILGFYHPLLVLPEARYDSEELFFICRHELLHLKHRDIYAKLLFAAAASLHWFNPLVHLMQKEAGIAMELACDERVIQGMDYEHRRAYTRVLLSALQKSCAKRTVISTQFYGGKQIMKKRLQNILTQKTRKHTALFLSAAAAAFSLSVLGCSFHEQSMLQEAADTDSRPKHTDPSAPSIQNSADTGQTKTNTANEKAADGSPAASNLEKDTVYKDGISKDTPTDQDGILKKDSADSNESAQENPADQDGISKKDSADSNSPAQEILAYIRDFDGTAVSFDDVEWVTVPSGRAASLGIEEEVTDSGFYVYNEDISLASLPVSKDCTFSILDWTASYEQTELTAEEFISVLSEREGTAIPYHLTVQNQKIIHILEQYIP